MDTFSADLVLAAQPTDLAAATGVPVPCAARPSTSFAHIDGPCRCFFGGPAPEFGANPQRTFLRAG